MSKKDVTCVLCSEKGHDSYECYYLDRAEAMDKESLGSRLFRYGVGLLVFFAILYLLSVDAPQTAEQQKPRPHADTCLSPGNGWTATIEPSGKEWSCVMRKGTTVKAFFYGN